MKNDPQLKSISGDSLREKKQQQEIQDLEQQVFGLKKQACLETTRDDCISGGKGGGALTKCMKQRAAK